jgi:hypothetical protein
MNIPACILILLVSLSLSLSFVDILHHCKSLDYTVRNGRMKDWKEAVVACYK